MTRRRSRSPSCRPSAAPNCCGPPGDAPGASVTHTNVYVSLAVERLPLADLQDRVCAQFGLHPRPELHVTLGYIGDAEHARLESLARELAPLAREPLDALTVSGLGGLVEGGSQIAPDTPPAELGGRSRVLWWAVERNDALQRAHALLRDAVRKVGLSDQFLPAEFFPHITVGSEPTGWDAHDVPKRAT